MKDTATFHLIDCISRDIALLPAYYGMGWNNRIALAIR